MHKHGNRLLTFKKITDKLAEWIISVAGVAVILAMFAMLVLIVWETAPLFMPASMKDAGSTALPPEIDPRDVVALGVEADLREQARLGGIVLRDGRAGHVVLCGSATESFALSRLPEAPENATILSAETASAGLYSLLWDDGTLTLYRLNANFAAEANKPVAATATYTLVLKRTVDLSRGAPLFAMARGEADKHRVVAVYADGTVTEKSVQPGKGLRARNKGVMSERSVHIERGGMISSAALNDNGQLYLGTNEGSIISVNLGGEGGADAAVEVTPAFRDRRAVSVLAFLNGGYALAVGDAAGGLSVWFPRREEGEFRFRRSVGWSDEGASPLALAPSGRDRGFIALDAGGVLRWLYSTTGEELLAAPAEAVPALALAVNQRMDNLVTLHGDGRLRFQRLDASYPEAGVRGYFQRLLYEGYEKPAFVWQSTGSDASEPKLSLVPLIWGSIKAAAYALLFATPIALAAAVYLSQFAAARWRARLKPAVEMLAAVPSVVIGFLAALWLAPLVERHLQYFVKQYQYDQRNALIIAIAMGFAVIPTIFSLAEDAVSAVPPSLSAASLALGASKWQTVWRVVLPTASPGIFTAVMLGFGRAVGETMIVLMAAGNTPILSLSPFNGMRTLSANIAVEMPEAPVGGTLYRTLFLCALLLFVLTLFINTAAEVFRHRLRRRYGRV